jgi:hypothetical protein
MEAAKFTFRDRLPVHGLTPLPNHPRNHPDENSEAARKDLRWMKVNALKTWVIDPVTVVKVNERTIYVIDGVQRLRVAEEIGMNYINCIVYNGINEAEAAHLSYQLNTIHPCKPLTATEEAHHLKTMRDEYAYSYSDLEEMGYGLKSEILGKISDDDITAEPEVQTPEIKTTETDHVSAGDERENQLLKTDIPLIHHEWRLAFAGIKRPIFGDRERTFENPFYGPNPTNNKIHIQEINL